MKHETSHILYEWQDIVQVVLAGETRVYGDYRSLIIHAMDNPGKFNIPETAVQTPVWYSEYMDRWMLSTGRELHLPHKLS